MDPYTKSILERARERQNKLMEKLPLREPNTLDIKASVSQPTLSSPQKENKVGRDSHSDPSLHVNVKDAGQIKETMSEGDITKFVRQNSTTRISSDMPGSPQQLKTLNIQRNNFNMEIKVSSEDNVRLEVEIEHRDDDDEDGEGKENFSTDKNEGDGVGLRENTRSRLNRLGKLCGSVEDADISSPIYRTEDKFAIDDSSDDNCDSKQSRKRAVLKGGKGLSGLSALAKNIDKWEDNLPAQRNPDLEKPGSSVSKQSSRKTKQLAPKPPTLSESKARRKSPAPKPPTQGEATSAPPRVVACLQNSKKVTAPEAEVVKGTPKQLKWDQAVIESLESQGFTRTTSNSRLVYNYSTEKKTDQGEVGKVATIKEAAGEEQEKLAELTKSPTKAVIGSPSKSNARGANVASRAALFESNSPTKTAKEKDPALLSVSERKALFEKNKGSVPVPVCPFGQSVPIKPALQPKPQLSQASKRTAIKVTTSSGDEQPVKTAVAESGTNIAGKVARLFQNKTTISEQQIQDTVKEQRQKEMDVLLNRFQRNKKVIEEVSTDQQSESDDEEDCSETTAMILTKPQQQQVKVEIVPSAPPMPSTSGQKRRSGERRCSTEDSPRVAAVLDDYKRIKVSPVSKDGRLYPCLSDIETATETETEHTAPQSADSSYEENFQESDDEPNTSFGRDILQTVSKNQTPQKRLIYDESTASDVSDILDDMDDYLDDAFPDGSPGPTPPKRKSTSPVTNGAQPSNSFNYKSFSPRTPQAKMSPKKTFKSPAKIPSPRKSDVLPFVVDGDNVLPLTHTVSFYRKQQTQANKTPVRQVIRQPDLEECVEVSDKEQKAVQTKIKALLERMEKLQTTISQTSQALNLCYATPEFNGSTEQVELEKVLLLTTHQRAAALREIERLKIEGTLCPQGQNGHNVYSEKGNLVISNITFPLKNDYVEALRMCGKGHHLVCLVKCGDQVVATKLVSTIATSKLNPDHDVSVPGSVQINDVYSNFTVTFEIYCLQAQEEITDRYVKYHIKKKANSKMTPKKSKAESRMVRPPIESPGGPQVVRSTTFACMGYVVFALQAINRKHWSLNNSPSLSPLEGTVEMRVKYSLEFSLEHHGFLTMFEDVSGFGAWHRRWCYLKGHTLSYWKYPDDEKTKPPIDTINFEECITTQIGPVNRDICARLNTVLVETQRQSRSSDKDSLVVVCQGDKTILRHLLSADSKEERVEWCTMLNKALLGPRTSK